MCMNRFPFGLGCSGVAICSLMTGVLQPEKTHDTKSHCMTQILKNQTKKTKQKNPYMFIFAIQIENGLVMAYLGVLCSCHCWHSSSWHMPRAAHQEGFSQKQTAIVHICISEQQRSSRNWDLSASTNASSACPGICTDCWLWPQQWCCPEDARQCGGSSC